MDNQQVPKADSEFQKKARKNHREWKIRLLSKGGQKADSGGGPYSKKPDYNRAKSAPPGFGGSLEESEQLDEVIRKKDGKYCLFSKKTNRNLGCYPTRAGAMKREKQVQYFKHLKENQHNQIINEELYQTLLEEGFLDIVLDAVGSGSAWIKDKLFSLLGVSDEKEKKGILGFLTSKLDSEQEVEAAEKNEKQIEQELKNYIDSERQKHKGKKALIYGHSQAGGLGLGLKSALTSLGYEVNLVVKSGANDDVLLSGIKNVGDPNEYDKVYLFVGGNWPKVPKVDAISSMVNFFGPKKTAVILPPTNTDENEVAAEGTRNKKNKDGIIQKFGGIVKVYIPYGKTEEFTDGIHMRNGSAGSKRLIQDLFLEKPSVPARAKVDPGSYSIKNTFNSKQKFHASLIEKRFSEEGMPRNLTLAALVNAYSESQFYPSAVGDNGCSVGLFQLNACGGRGDGMSKEDRKNPEINIQKIISDIKKNRGTGKILNKATSGASLEDLTYDFCFHVERPRNREFNCRQRINLISDVLNVSNLTESKKITIKFGQPLTEGKTKGKEDRCTRIAKSKYDAWPSAYASGAVVKCRQGKIWKNIKEEEELEEEWSGSERKKRKANCSNPKGFTMKQFCKNQRTRSKQGEKTNERLNKTDPGHTFKGQSHFYSNDQEEEMEEGRKLGKPSSETNLGDWFKRKGSPGKGGGWVDCNTCRDGKCKPCGRQEGEKRSKYPRCRPTPSQCKGYKRRGDNLQREEQ